MNKALTSPIALLLITGSLIGLNFPLSKIGMQGGISPIMWSMLVSLSAVIFILPILLFKGGLSLPNKHMLRFAFFSGIITFVLPNLILYSVIPHIGAGYTGLMFALSPVLTLLLALTFRVKAPKLLGMVGIVIGLLGAVFVSVNRAIMPEAPDTFWLIAAFIVPLLLASGNIYRTIDWPKETKPDVLVFWSHLFSVIIFAVLQLFQKGEVPIFELSLSPFVVMAQALAAGLTYPFFFRLQAIGGPVLLSQIGYVAAAVSLVAGTAVLGELYSTTTWLGSGIIAFGIAITIYSSTDQKLKAS